MPQDRTGKGRRHGFTLVECLVVITVIGLLAALLLPAVLAAREAMRRANCTSNLRQMGVALHSYASQSNAFPAGNNGRGVSLHTVLLPFIDQNNLYNSLNLCTKRLPIISEENGTASALAVGVYLCPSEPLGGRSAESNNSYPGNLGTFFDSLTRKHKQDGVFTSKGGPVDPSAVLDGLSNTAGLSEWVRGQPVRNLLVKSDKSAGVDYLHDLCIRENGKGSDMHKLPNWFSGNLGSSLYNHVMNINQNTCIMNDKVNIGAWTVGSRHGAGVNVLYMDGRVSFVKETISLGAWRSQGTRAGGEISSDAN